MTAVSMRAKSDSAGAHRRQSTNRALFTVAMLISGSAYGGGMRAEEWFEDPSSVRLAKAVERGETTQVTRMIGEGTPVNVVGRKGWNLLDWALWHEQKGSFRTLLELGVDVNLLEDTYETTIVHRVAMNPDPAWLQMALEFGGDPNVADHARRTPLFHSYSSLETAKIDLLLAAGADIDHQDVSGSTVLHSAARSMHYGVVLHLLDKGASPSLTEHSGQDVSSLLRGTIPAAAEREALRQEVLAFLENTDGAADSGPRVSP